MDIIGLDNGITVKKHSKPIVNYIVSRMDVWGYKNDYDEYDICYWRKHYNVRGIILGIIQSNDWKGCCLPVSRTEVKQIGQALSELNESNWEDEAGCLWSFDEAKVWIKRDIRHLKILNILMWIWNDIEVYFYDSY